MRDSRAPDRRELHRANLGSSLLIDLLERVGLSDEHVVISGPSAFDKERVARFIHAESPRSAAAFVVYRTKRLGADGSCSAGPRRDRPGDDIDGAWTAARGGTLFLTELCDLVDREQARLLRALEGHAPRALDAARPVRVIAATSREGDRAARCTTLRSSLFHRLNVMSVRVPPSDETRDPRFLQLTEPHLTFKEEKTRLLEAWEPEYLRELLSQVEGNLTAAARTAGIARAHLYRLLKKHGLAR